MTEALQFKTKKKLHIMPLSTWQLPLLEDHNITTASITSHPHSPSNMTSDQCTIIFITWAAYCHCMTKIEHHIWQTHQTPPRRPSQHAPNHCHHSMTKKTLADCHNNIISKVLLGCCSWEARVLRLENSRASTCYTFSVHDAVMWQTQ